MTISDPTAYFSVEQGLEVSSLFGLKEGFKLHSGALVAAGSTSITFGC